jgi:hypothetical protein
MTRIDEAISDALNISTDMKAQILDPKPLIPRPEQSLMTQDDTTEHIDVDYQYSRENFYNLIERGQDAITGILDLAKEQEHPRTYEVAGQLIKTVSEVTERLADLQEKMKKLKEVPKEGPSSVTNALFVGSTMELQALLKDKTNDR